MASRSEEMAAEVAHGADGFLFNLFEQAIAQICEASLPDDRFLARWVSLLETRQAWCAARGIRYVTLIAPARHVVYDDKLPAGLSVSPNRAAMRLLRSIAPGLRVGALYPGAELRAARASDDVFFKTDEHMNDFGGYICYRAILRAIETDIPLQPVAIESFASSKRRFIGNLGIRVVSEPSEEATFLDLPGKRPPFAGIRNKKNDRGVDIFLNDNRRLPSAIVFGDSNLHTVLPFLQPHFSRIISLPANQRFYFDLVRTELPDVVINFISELALGHEASGYVAAPVDNDATDFVDFYDEIALPAAHEPLIAIDFGKNGAGARFLRRGWSHIEERHTWMIGEESVLELPSLSIDGRQARFFTLEIELFPILIPGVKPRQRLAISVKVGDGWREIGDFAIVGERTIRGSIPIGLVPRDKPWRMKFVHPDGFMPSSISDSADDRVLSIALRSLAIRISARPGNRTVSEVLDALLTRKPPTIAPPEAETEASAIDPDRAALESRVTRPVSPQTAR